MPNQYVNKVTVNGSTILDLTSDTVDAAHLLSGYTAHDASGALITGTAINGAEGSAYQDQDGYIVLGEGESSAPQGTLSVTANGTYDVSDYAQASVAVPVGMTETELKDYIQRSSGFKDIDWPDGVSSIGPYAFAYCQHFRPSSLPNGITSIGTSAFQNCSNLALTSLPSGVTTIGSSAFAYCSNLALTSLPSGVTAISASAFQNCSNLALTSLPSGVTTINGSAFQNCSNLALTSLPSGVNSIGGTAFMNCKSLAITELPSGITSLASNTFVGCTGLTSISSDGVITSCSYPVFTGNNANPTMRLTSASFPNMTLTSKLGYVFGNTTEAYACQLLEFCDIGSTVGIAVNAFANCHSLTTLVLRKTASVCTLDNVSAFTNTPMSGYNNQTGTVYVPSALINSYKTATNWSTLYNNGTVTFEAIEGSDYDRD